MNLVFQLGIRGDVYPVELEYHSTGVEPLLKHQAFEQHQGRVGAGAFLAGAHGVMAKQDGFHARPVDSVVELVHSPCYIDEYAEAEMCVVDRQQSGCKL